jgi:hypothetical protein
MQVDTLKRKATFLKREPLALDSLEQADVQVNPA